MEASEQKPVILVVDDSPDVIALLGGMLRDLYRVKAATSGEACLKIVDSANPPDLVLLDILMPGLDGFETCRRLKALASGASIPVLFLTARSSDGDVEQGLAAGGADLIAKPPNAAVLRARIATHLELKFLRERHL